MPSMHREQVFFCFPFALSFRFSSHQRARSILSGMSCFIEVCDCDGPVLASSLSLRLSRVQTLSTVRAHTDVDCNGKAGRAVDVEVKGGHCLGPVERMLRTSASLQEASASADYKGQELHFFSLVFSHS